MFGLNLLYIYIYIISINLILAASKNELRFNTDGEFTILQITDLHFGEAGEKDYNSKILVEKLLNWTKPDLVVVTGDSVSGYAWDKKKNILF